MENYELSLWDGLSEVRTIPTLTARNCTGIDGFMSLMEELAILSETVPVSHLIEEILNKTGYLKELESSKDIEDKSRIENLKELVSDAVDFEKTSEDKSLSAYLEKVSLVQDTDKLEEEDDDNGAVVLMTVHSAKGLEFPIVFMVGMENGLFPGAASFDSDTEMEESRRLCYVGITRAKEMLYMTSAEVRRVFGRTVSYPQSDFIAEIKPNLREYVVMETKRSAIDATRAMMAGKDMRNNPHSIRSGYSSNGARGFGTNKAKTLSDSNTSGVSEDITVGRKVRHKVFGLGTVVAVADSNGDKKLTIAFNSQGIKNLMQSIAKLEVL